MDQAVNDIRLKHWEAVILEAGSAGISKKQWTAEHGIPERQFYYWQKKLRDRELVKLHPTELNQADPAITASPVGTGFLELSAPEPGMSTAAAAEKPVFITGSQSPELVLVAGPYRLEIREAVSEKALRTVLKVIRDA